MARNTNYPQRSCRQPVWGTNDAAYSCDLKVDNLGMSHIGPCMSLSVPASVQRRKTWEESEEGKAELAAAAEQDPEEGWLG